MLHSRQGECEAAEEHYRNATQLDPGNAQLHCDRAQVSANLALAKAMEGRIEEAQHEYQRALEHNPKLQGARDMLASLQSLPVNRQAGYVETSSSMPSGDVVPAWHHESPGPYPAPAELAR